MNITGLFPWDPRYQRPLLNRALYDMPQVLASQCQLTGQPMTLREYIERAPEIWLDQPRTKKAEQDQVGDVINLLEEITEEL